MPKKGFKSITIKANLHKELCELALRRKESLASLVSQALQEFLDSLGGSTL